MWLYLRYDKVSRWYRRLLPSWNKWCTVVIYKLQTQNMQGDLSFLDFSCFFSNAFAHCSIVHSFYWSYHAVNWCKVEFSCGNLITTRQCLYNFTMLYAFQCFHYSSRKFYWQSILVFVNPCVLIWGFRQCWTVYQCLIC